MRIFKTAFVICCVWTFANHSAAQESAVAVFKAFKSHCVHCHGEGDHAEAGVDLLKAADEKSLEATPQLLYRLVKVLRDNEMPPADEPKLGAEKRQQMLSYLDAVLGRVLKTEPYNPIPIRRMNRFQYNNAVVDLLGLDRDVFQLNERLLRRRENYFRPATKKMPDQVRVSSRPLSKDIDNQRPEGFRGVAAFPQDKRAEHGFDNRADHLTMSPLLMESFLKLSQTIVESPDLNPRECRRWDELFASPNKPARSRIAGRFEGESAGPVKVIGKPKGRAARQDMAGFGRDWSGSAQLFWMCPRKGLELEVAFEATESGTGFSFGFTQANDYGTFDVFLDGKLIAKGLDFYKTRVSLVKRAISAKVASGPHTLKFVCVGKNPKSVRHFFGLDYFDITGTNKKETPPDLPPISELASVRPRLKKLLRRAFRRPVDQTTLDRFVKFAEQQLDAGASYEETMRTVVGAVLSMPEFLYIYETGQIGNSATSPGSQKKGVEQAQQSRLAGREKITDFELACRLAQFFWSSIPDEPLLDLAEQNKLSDPKTLDAQIDRMLNDRRSSRFCDNFPGQWLQLDRLITSVADKKKFPQFYISGYRTSMHMISEPLLVFETIYLEDRSIVELLHSDFTYESALLKANYAGHRKAPGEVQVQLFRRVPVKDARRGGIITNAAVMTMTSTSTRTQPITRGAWINAVIFNDPPEPPPADVPPLPEVDKAELEKLTIRERLAIHRKRADCAACHDKIDPLGFALENYNPVGVWRDKYENDRQVDVSGVLFNQYKFESLVEFKNLLIQEKQRFFRGFVAHLLGYALGRELGPADYPAIEAITREAVAGNDRMRSVLKAVAKSDPFLHKNSSLQGEHTASASNSIGASN